MCSHQKNILLYFGFIFCFVNFVYLIEEDVSVESSCENGSCPREEKEEAMEDHEKLKYTKKGNNSLFNIRNTNTKINNRK